MLYSNQETNKTYQFLMYITSRNFYVDYYNLKLQLFPNMTIFITLLRKCFSLLTKWEIYKEILYKEVHCGIHQKTYIDKKNLLKWRF